MPKKPHAHRYASAFPLPFETAGLYVRRQPQHSAPLSIGKLSLPFRITHHTDTLRGTQEAEDRLWRQHHATLAQLEGAHPRKFSVATEHADVTTDGSVMATLDAPPQIDGVVSHLPIGQRSSCQTASGREAISQLLQALWQWSPHDTGRYVGGQQGLTQQSPEVQVFVEHELPGLVTAVLAEVPELLNVFDSYGWSCGSGDGLDRFCAPLAIEDLVSLRNDVSLGFTTRDDSNVPLLPSKADVQAEEDRAAMNISLHGNPFGPQKVNPVEMEIAMRELERINRASSEKDGTLAAVGSGSRSEQDVEEAEEEAYWSPGDDEEEEDAEEEREEATLVVAIMTEEQELQAAIEASKSG